MALVVICNVSRIWNWNRAWNQDEVISMSMCMIWEIDGLWFTIGHDARARCQNLCEIGNRNRSRNLLNGLGWHAMNWKLLRLNRIDQRVGKRNTLCSRNLMGTPKRTTFPLRMELIWWFGTKNMMIWRSRNWNDGRNVITEYQFSSLLVEWTSFCSEWQCDLS